MDSSAAEKPAEQRGLVEARDEQVPLTPHHLADEAVGRALSEAIESVGRAGSSSSLLAMNTVQRLVRTMAAWIVTLEARRAKLADEIERREAELQELERQIEAERRSAESVAQAGKAWGVEIEREVRSRKLELQVESQALEDQLRAITASLTKLATTENPTATPEDFNGNHG